MSWLRLLPGVWVNQNWLDVCRSLASWVRIHKSDNYGVSFITCWRALRESLSLEVFMPVQLQKRILWSLETSELLGTQIQNAKNVILLKPHIQKENKKKMFFINELVKICLICFLLKLQWTQKSTALTMVI